MDNDENNKKDTPIPSPLDMSPDVEVEEFVFDDGGEEDLRATLKKLRKDLKEAQKERMEYLTGLQRERADFMNYRKSEIEQFKKIESQAKEHFVEELLPVLDSYDMAFSNKEAWEKVEKNWRMGVEYIHQQLLKVLSENGVEEIPMNVGDQFDHNLHESVENIPTDDSEKDHTIAKVLQKGYKTGEKIIRPARVNVFAYNNK